MVFRIIYHLVSQFISWSLFDQFILVNTTSNKAIISLQKIIGLFSLHLLNVYYKHWNDIYQVVRIANVSPMNICILNIYLCCLYSYRRNSSLYCDCGGNFTLWNRDNHTVIIPGGFPRGIDYQRLWWWRYDIDIHINGFHFHMPLSHDVTFLANKFLKADAHGFLQPKIDER